MILGILTSQICSREPRIVERARHKLGRSRRETESGLISDLLLATMGTFPGA